MPMEASALIGSLGGIGSIAKEVFGDGENGQDAAQRRGRTVPSAGNRGNDE